MPRFLLPKQSTQHRVAAIALYRALLSRCASTPLSNEHRGSLQNAIRQKFRKNRKIQSPYQLSITFRAGYETLDHLDAARHGDAASTQFLTSFISTLPSGLTRPPPLKSQPLPRPLKMLAHLPPEKAVLNVRPRQNVSGSRKVPMLCSANGIPFLRIKKPQPPSLSRILRQKIAWRQTSFDRRILIGNYWMPLARQEDEWDEILRTSLGIDDGKGNAKETKWVDVLIQADFENARQYDRALARDREIAKKMLRIVDQETALALAEGQKIIRGRKGRPRPKSNSQ